VAGSRARWPIWVPFRSHCLCPHICQSIGLGQIVRGEARTWNGYVDRHFWRATVAVEAASDLSVQPSAAPDPVKRGSTASVANIGPHAATAVVFTQGLPGGVTVPSVATRADSPMAAPEGTCAASGSGTVRCELGTVAAGASWTVVVKAHGHRQ
jgi:hypothetical protein